MAQVVDDFPDLFVVFGGARLANQTLEPFTAISDLCA